MRIAHWTLKNGSGMNNMAQELSDAEKALGHDSEVFSSFDLSDHEKGKGFDIHVSHSHVPDSVRRAGGKTVWVGHGTPEHCFHTSVEDGTRGGYGHSDTIMLIQWWLQNADALVTFWPRHQKIWQSLCDKGRTVHCVPMGVRRDFWKPMESKGRFAGTPSVFSCENAHYIKWPLDLVIMWGWVSEIVDGARLHLVYLPRDQHRWWFPLINRIGAGYKAYVTANAFGSVDLRNAFNSVDYFTSFVHYGDFNRSCMEAKACGAKVISWEGNLYADYWISEGDQRRQCDQMVEILTGRAERHETADVPDISETAREMIKIYEGVL